MPDSDISILPRRRFLHDTAVSAICLANPWDLEAFAAAETNATVWQLNLKNGRATNCSLSLARVVSAGQGKLCVEADSRHDNTPWHSSIFVPAGPLKSGQDYVITVSYEILSRVTEDSYFYVFARSNHIGQDADKWQTWSGEAGQHGIAKLRVSLTAGVLCNTADWLIENNRFFHNQHAAMLLEIDVSPGLWSEGFGARNVIVRGNTFDYCNPKGAGEGSAIELGATVRGGSTSYTLLDGILFDKNQFEETPGAAIVASAFRNLVIQDNTIVNRTKPSATEKMRGAIRAESGTGLWVVGNKWTTPSGVQPPALFYDPDTTHSIVSRTNKPRP